VKVGEGMKVVLNRLGVGVKAVMHIKACGCIY
jgi:hypothetical protein